MNHLAQRWEPETNRRVLFNETGSTGIHIEHAWNYNHDTSVVTNTEPHYTGFEFPIVITIMNKYCVEDLWEWHPWNENNEFMSVRLCVWFSKPCKIAWKFGTGDQAYIVMKIYVNLLVIPGTVCERLSTLIRLLKRKCFVLKIVHDLCYVSY